MKAWLVSVGVLFVLVEFFFWVRNFILPLPVYILAGAFIAIASNYDKGIMVLFRQQTTESEDNIITQTASLIEERKALKQNDLSETVMHLNSSEKSNN